MATSCRRFAAEVITGGKCVGAHEIRLGWNLALTKQFRLGWNLALPKQFRLGWNLALPKTIPARMEPRPPKQFRLGGNLVVQDGIDSSLLFDAVQGCGGAQED